MVKFSPEFNWKTEITGNTPNSYLSIFNKKWVDHLKSIIPVYADNIQLSGGKRIRPLLVCWGYILSGKYPDITAKEKLAQLAVSMELIHKASVLVDDMIDYDDERNGNSSFHKNHSEHETILLCVYLLGKAVKNMNLCFYNTRHWSSYNKSISLLSQTISDMAKGALKEITYSRDELMNVNEVRRIMAEETASLFTNSMLLGYSMNNQNGAHYKLVESIGNNCGYAFQLMNDLEPFYNENGTHKTKGKNNIDISRSRKNILVAYTNELITKKERTRLYYLTHNGDKEELAFDYIKDLIEKYKILAIIEKDLNTRYKEIISDYNLILSNNAGSKTPQFNFKEFVTYMFHAGFQNLNKFTNDERSNILKTENKKENAVDT